MSQKPNSFGHGVSGTTVSAATVATTKYSVGTAFYNLYGDRYAAITVKSDKAFSLYVFGAMSSFASTADSGTAAGALLASYPGQVINGTATTGIDGAVFYVPIAGFSHILPVLYQSSGSSATVTISYRTFND